MKAHQRHVMQDPWSDASLGKTAPFGYARTSQAGDIATVWQQIQRQSLLVPESSRAGSPRREYGGDAAGVAPCRTVVQGQQQVLFEDVFLDTEKRNEVSPDRTCLL